MKRPALAAALLLLLCLTGCKSAAESCTDSGGRYEQTGQMPVTTFISTGKVLIPVTNVVPVYECIGSTP